MSPVFRNSLLQDQWQCNLSTPTSRGTDEASPPTRHPQLSLGLQNFVFDTVRAEDRAKGVAVWNTVNEMGWFVGSMRGGWLAMVAPSTIPLPALELHLLSNLPVVLFISGLLRLMVSLSLLGTFNEARSVEAISHRR